MQLIIPRLGLERSITYGLLTYTVGQVRGFRRSLLLPLLLMPRFRALVA